MQRPATRRTFAPALDRNPLVLGAAAAGVGLLLGVALRHVRWANVQPAPAPDRPADEAELGSGARVSAAGAREPAPASARGLDADRPGEIPARGWREVLARTRREVRDDGIALVAAGVAFYLFLALFPALFAAVSVYGLVADPATVERQLEGLARVAPGGALEVIRSQLQEIVRTSESTLGWGAAIAVLLALWSASKGAKAVIQAINVAYDEQEKRGLLRLQGLALLFTVGGVVFLTVSAGLIAVFPHLLGSLGLEPAGVVILFVVQWVVLLLAMLGALAILYRYAPSREEPRWRWVTLGSWIASGVWLAASAAFSWYAGRFGSFNETYGAIAGAVLLLLWLQISAFVVLLGAELNAELENQTAVDSTTGPPLPMGSRGAMVADTPPPAT